MKISRVKCVLATECFMRGKNAVKQKVIRLLKTGSDEGSYYFVQDCMRDCIDSFFEDIDNFEQCEDGYYDLLVRFYPGCYEYPNEGWVEYTLVKGEK